MAFAGAFSGVAQTSDEVTDDDWATTRADAARTGATDNSGPSGPYADEVWNTNDEDINTGGVGGAVISDDTVYVGSTTYSEYNRHNGQVIAYNATTGGVLWQRTDLAAVETSPVVVGDTVFVSALAPSHDRPAPSTGKAGLFALDAETGETKWNRDGNRPMYADGVLYVATGDGTEAVNPQSGTTVWTNTDVRGSMSVSDGTVYVLNDTGDSMSALDAQTGTEQWSASLPVSEDDVSGYTVSNGVIYLTANPNTVYALSADDGGVLWTKTAEHSLPDSSIDEISAPAIADGVVYVGTDDDLDDTGYSQKEGEEMGAVHAFGAQTGEQVWRFETAADIQGPPIVTDGQLYIGGEYTNQDSWEDESEYADHPSDLLDTVYERKVVYALNAESGDEQWSYAVPRSYGDDRVRGLAVANGYLYEWTDDDAPSTPRGDMFVIKTSDDEPEKNEQLADDSLYEQNADPTATITTDDEDGQYEGGQTVVLSATESSDSDGEIVSYEWDVDGDGEYETSGTTAEVTVPECETVTVNLRVTDDDGGVSTGSAELRAQ
ncbi:outer membrane protein assembly factor BamB family protein [Haladaptatus cibarius]|uniref:outer membrane protein assembly factor BamB family protein n=1 Tax=Haladaptatus cibarius TaxID=453847 RepID=UPI000678F743|nr:PQQ-binding-like beta-propeller repeat protein [Haladaptatus cibarius]